MTRVFVLAAVVVILCAGFAGCERASGPPKALSQGTFYLDLEETLEGEPTQLNISELFVTRRLLYLGYDRVTDPAAADYRIEGSVHCTYFQAHEFHFYEQSVHLEHQFKALVKCTVTDTKKKEGDPNRSEVLDFPEPLIYGRTEMEDARRDIRRDAGTLLAKKIFHGQLFGNPELVALVGALGDSRETRTFNDIASEFERRDHEAVPYLLEALDDDRKVALKGEYPGLTDENRDKFLFQHAADFVLCRILNRESGLNLDSTTDYIQDVQLAWTWAWEDLQHVPQEYRVRSKERATSIKAAPKGQPQANESVGEDG